MFHGYPMVFVHRGDRRDEMHSPFRQKLVEMNLNYIHGRSRTEIQRFSYYNPANP